MFYVLIYIGFSEVSLGNTKFIQPIKTMELKDLIIVLELDIKM